MEALTDPRTLGEVALVTVGAIMFGYFVFKIWPKRLNPILFGFLATFLVAGGLAYLGVASAAVALILLVTLSLLLALAALLM